MKLTAKQYRYEWQRDRQTISQLTTVVIWVHQIIIIDVLNYVNVSAADRIEDSE